MNLQELTKEYGSIELSYEIEKNFLDKVINRVEAELELDDNASNLMQSIIKFGIEVQNSDSKNIISNLNSWVNDFEPSDYYYNEKTAKFDRKTAKNDAKLLNEIAGDCEEAIMDAVKNQGDADWQLAYEAFSRIALIIEDIDFDVEELGLKELEEDDIYDTLSDNFDIDEYENEQEYYEQIINLAIDLSQQYLNKNNIVLSEKEQQNFNETFSNEIVYKDLDIVEKAEVYDLAESVAKAIKENSQEQSSKELGLHNKISNKKR